MGLPADLPVIQRMYDLILWYAPFLNKLPRDHKFVLGDRIQAALYGILEGLIRARYARGNWGELGDATRISKPKRLPPTPTTVHPNESSQPFTPQDFPAQIPPKKNAMPWAV